MTWPVLIHETTRSATHSAVVDGCTFRARSLTVCDGAEDC
jgi:hypothetical protein